MSIHRVAFCGLGTMGAGMVRNLMAAGFSVTGWNRTASRAEPLVRAGMALAATPREAASDSDVVVLCLSDDAAVREVALDADSGALSGIGTGSLVIDCSTTGPSLTRELETEVLERGGAFIDAPITGSKLGAEGGKLTYMVGGPSAAVARARPVFEATSKYVVHVGDQVGLGQSAKYCLNMTQAVVLEGVLEGYTLARRLGVPLAKMAELLENSAGKTGVGTFKTPYLQAEDYSAHFKLWLMHKDLHLALAEASRLRLPLPLARTVCTLYDQGVAEGMGDEDFLVLARLLERWAGIKLRDDGDPA